MVNYANGDMVGHTGIYEAIEKAVKAIDECVKDTVEAAEKQMMEHLYKGKPIIIETSRMRRKGKRIVHFFDKKYAGSYHTMILLGVDEEGQVVFTDSATRDWAGEQIGRASCRERV